MKTFWVILSCVCAIVAVVMALRGDYDKAFVIAAAGAVSWFLNYRVHVREKLRQRYEAEDQELGEDDDEQA